MSLRKLFRLDRTHADVPRDVDDELAFHIDMRVDALVKRGWSIDEARREAQRQFGNIDDVRGSCIALDNQRERTVNRVNFISEFLHDVRYALRVLRRSYAFAIAVILVLSIGIGANTAIYSMIDALIRRTLPVPHPERLLAIGDPARVSSLSQGNIRTDLLSYPAYSALRRDSVLGTNLLASGRPPRLDVRVEQTQVDVEHPRGRLVSDNYFRILGVPAQSGTVFRGDEDAHVGASPVVVISDAYWTRRFNRDAAVVGKTITVNGSAFTILGVTPKWFTGEIVGASMDMWLPVSMQAVLSPHQTMISDELSAWLLLMQRVPDNMSMSQGTQRITNAISQWVADHSTAPVVDQPKARISDGSRGFSRARKTLGAPLMVLMIGVGLLLLLVCANVANLLLARAVSRGREMSVRLAIGARRGRLVRQLVTESIVLAAFGSIGGLVVAWYTGRLLLFLSDTGSTTPIDLRLDPPVLAFTAFVAVLAVILFGVTPALHASRVDLASAMRGNAIGLGRSARAPVPDLNQLLVSAQVALSLALLVSAGLLARDLRYLESIDTGIDRDHLLTSYIDTYGAGYSDARLAVFTEDMRNQMVAMPGVRAVSYSTNGIFSGQENATTIDVNGYTPVKPSDMEVNYDDVGPDYAQAIGARIIAGRDINEHDVKGSQPVVLVNEAFVNRFFKGQNAIDQSFKTDSTGVRIVGVIADVRDHTIDGTIEPRFYYAYQQAAFFDGPVLRVIVRTTGAPANFELSARDIVRKIDPSLIVEDMETVSVRMDRSIAASRLVMQLASGFGVLALLLAAIGLYGVMSCVVSRRTSEIGLRIALGAGQKRVLVQVLLDAMKLVLIGVVVGTPLAIALARALESQLHGVSAMDPFTIIASLVVLTVSAVAAAFFPALRASRVAPMLAIGR